MKLNKKILKSLIMESLQEVNDEKYDPDAFQPYEDEPRGASRELEGPTPEQLAPSDIANYFRQVGQEIENRIKAFEDAPRFEMQPAMTPEDVKTALDEMDRVQKDLEEIKKVLQDLEKRDMRGED